MKVHIGAPLDGSFPHMTIMAETDLEQQFYKVLLGEEGSAEMIETWTGDRDKEANGIHIRRKTGSEDYGSKSLKAVIEYIENMTYREWLEFEKGFQKKYKDVI